MASKRIRAPLRSSICQLNRSTLSLDAIQISIQPFNRTLTTTASSSYATVQTSKPLDTFLPKSSNPFETSTLATIHAWPSLEPLRFEKYAPKYLNLPIRKDILHRAIVYEGDNTRLGTASTKWRDEIHGSARKLRPQKGSGRARLGDRGSPMLRGGGVAFGPKPRDFGTELPRKVYDLAWRTALSHRFALGELIIVDSPMEIEYARTKYVQDMLLSHRWMGSSAFVTLNKRENFEEALKDCVKKVAGGECMTWEDVDVKDLLSGRRLVIERRALQNILLNRRSDLTNRTPSKLELDIALKEEAQEVYLKGKAKASLVREKKFIEGDMKKEARRLEQEEEAELEAEAWDDVAAGKEQTAGPIRT